MHGDFQSTFQHDYLPWKSCKQKPFNYERQPQKHAYDPSTLLSSYQSEYIKRPLPDKEIRELPKIPSSQPFTSQSDYQTNYQRFPLPLKPPVTKKQYKSAPRQVPWDTTYGVDYIPKPIGEKEQFKPTVKDGPNCGTDFGSSIVHSQILIIFQQKQVLIKWMCQSSDYQRFLRLILNF